MFWGSELFDSLGRFAGLGKEMERIALESLAPYPALQIETAAIATAKQLADIRPGEGVVGTIWHTYAIIEQRTPSAAPAMHAARQQNGGIDFRILNLVHWPGVLLSLLLLPLLIAGARWSICDDVRRLAALAAVAVLSNAIICGILSNPHNRYGARLAWLPALVMIVAALRLREQKDRA